MKAFVSQLAEWLLTAGCLTRSYPPPKIPPTQSTGPSQWLVHVGDARAPFPLLGTTLKGPPSFRSPHGISWWLCCNYITVQVASCSLLFPHSLADAALEVSPIIRHRSLSQEFPTRWPSWRRERLSFEGEQNSEQGKYPRRQTLKYNQSFLWDWRGCSWARGGVGRMRGLGDRWKQSKHWPNQPANINHLVVSLFTVINKKRCNACLDS